VRSRILLGVGAWLLGAILATAGSLYAVDQLGNGLLAQPSQTSVAMVNAELALENSERLGPSAAPSASGSASPAAAFGPGRNPLRRPARQAGSPAPGVLLASPDGTAVATCARGAAYLVYWSPQQGYEADQVVRGPRPVASVAFRNSAGGGVVLSVSCRGATPAEHLAPIQPDGSWSGHDD